MLRCPIAFSLALALAGGAVLGQEPPTRPTFTSKSELVVVDVVVSDARNRPVRGLSVEDFVVKEDGRQRRIVAFEAFAGDDPSVPPARTTARGASLRLTPQLARAATVLFVDDGRLSPEQSAKLRPALKTLLATLGERSDSLMLVAPLSKVSVAGRLPADAPALAAAIDQIVGRRFADIPSLPIGDAEALAIERGDRQMLSRVTARYSALNPDFSQTTAGSLARTRANEVAHDARVRRHASFDVAGLCLDWLSNRPGRRSLIVISAGFAAEAADPGYRDLVTRSLRVNTPIHFLDVRGLQGWGRYNGLQYGPALSPAANAGPWGWSDEAAGARELAADTGGMSIANLDDLNRGLQQLFDTMTSYYLLAYEPPPGAGSGFRRIRVEVRGKDMQVRARRGYYAER
jgi:VWFA-related protein